VVRPKAGARRFNTDEVTISGFWANPLPPFHAHIGRKESSHRFNNATPVLL